MTNEGRKQKFSLDRDLCFLSIPFGDKRIDVFWNTVDNCWNEIENN